MKYDVMSNSTIFSTSKLIYSRFGVSMNLVNGLIKKKNRPS